MSLTMRESCTVKSGVSSLSDNVRRLVDPVSRMKGCPPSCRVPDTDDAALGFQQHRPSYRGGEEEGKTYEERRVTRDE